MDAKTGAKIADSWGFMKTAERQFTTISGVPVEPVYGPNGDLQNPPPGEFPYTRGIHRDMYRGKLWTMRQFSGFATPEETNRRYHYLLAQGQTGLSVAFDLPTLMGYDADHALSEGEVGKCGASISSLEDMEILFRGIPLGDVTVSMTINSPASVLWAMYLAVAEQQGVRLDAALRHAAERHPEGIHRAEGVHLSRRAPSMRLVTDTIEFGARHTPQFNPDFDQRLSHSRGRLDRRAGTGLHPARRHRVRGLGARARSRRSTSSRRASASSSTRTAISSRRSPSTAPRARSGRTSCATATARKASAA